MPSNKTRDKVEGKLESVKGRVKQATGKATGNPDKEAQGVGERLKGAVKNKKGHLKDLA
jgi:uncharacterized protein YjbJ (UPF0337 family)